MILRARKVKGSRNERYIPEERYEEKCILSNWYSIFKVVNGIDFSVN